MIYTDPGNPFMADESKASVGFALAVDMKVAVGTEETVAPEAEALLARLRAGDRAAMHRVYELYHRRLFAVMARICGAQEAEELLQDVFIRAFQGVSKFRGDSQLSTWLYRMAVNAALSHATRAMARQKKQVAIDDASPALELSTVAPGTESDPHLRRRLEEALNELPPGYRTVLVLHDVEGLEHEEIAQILGCRVGTSKSQLHKARAQMRDRLRLGETP